MNTRLTILLAVITASLTVYADSIKWRAKQCPQLPNHIVIAIKADSFAGDYIHELVFRVLVNGKEREFRLAPSKSIAKKLLSVGFFDTGAKVEKIKTVRLSYKRGKHAGYFVSSGKRPSKVYFTPRPRNACE